MGTVARAGKPAPVARFALSLVCGAAGRRFRCGRQGCRPLRISIEFFDRSFANGFAALAFRHRRARAEHRHRPGPDPVSQPRRHGSGQQNAVGTPDYGASVKVKGSSGPVSLDKNGDGFLDSTEIEPGSQLAKRLQTRDANGDGKLSRDEYYFK